MWCNCAVLMAVVGQVTLTGCPQWLLLCNAYGCGRPGHIDSIKDTTQHSISVWYKTWLYWEMHRTSPNSCYTKTGVLIEAVISSQHNVGATSEVLCNVTQMSSVSGESRSTRMPTRSFRRQHSTGRIDSQGSLWTTKEQQWVATLGAFPWYSSCQKAANLIPKTNVLIWGHFIHFGTKANFDPCVLCPLV